MLRTAQVDSYQKTPIAMAFAKALQGQKTPAASAIMAAAKKPAPSGDNFAGTARKAAKLSIANARTANFTDVTS